MAILKTIGLFACIYIGFGLLLFVMQRSLLYFPTPEFSHPFNEIDIKVGDKTTRVIVINPDKPDALLYFGGNGESMAYSAIEVATAITDQTVYMVNYPGYGGSEGSPSEAAIFASARAVYERIAPQHNKVSVLGRSLGSGVAVMLAAEEPIHRLILVTPYDSVRAVAQGRFPIYPAGLILNDHFDSVSRLEKVESPMLGLVADHDRVIPRRYTNNLLKAWKSPSEVHVLPGTDHNSISQHAGYYESIMEHLNK